MMKHFVLIPVINISGLSGDSRVVQVDVTGKFHKKHSEKFCNNITLSFVNSLQEIVKVGGSCNQLEVSVNLNAQNLNSLRC